MLDKASADVSIDTKDNCQTLHNKQFNSTFHLSDHSVVQQAFVIAEHCQRIVNVKCLIEVADDFAAIGNR